MEGTFRFISSLTGSQIFKDFNSLHLIPKSTFLAMLHQSTTKTATELLWDVLV